MVIHLLIVDDDDEDRTLLKEAIATLVPNAICDEAIDGSDALKKLCHPYIPDFIFVDLNMPRLNGFQFLDVIKRDAQLKNIPVIIYTTSKLEIDKEKAYTMGAVHFITKPHQLSELQQELHYVLEKKWLEIAH